MSGPSRAGSGWDGLLATIARSHLTHPPLPDGSIDPDHCVQVCRHKWHELRMEGKREPSISDRDLLIWERRCGGATLADIAGEVGLSTARVSQIVREVREKLWRG